MPEQTDLAHMGDLGKYLRQVQRLQEMEREFSSNSAAHIMHYQSEHNRSIISAYQGAEVSNRTRKSEIGQRAEQIRRNIILGTYLAYRGPEKFDNEVRRRLEQKESPLEIFVGTYDEAPVTSLPDEASKMTHRLAALPTPSVIYMFREIRPGTENRRIPITDVYFTAASPSRYSESAEPQEPAQPDAPPHKPTLQEQLATHISKLQEKYGSKAVFKQYRNRPKETGTPPSAYTRWSRSIRGPFTDTRSCQLNRTDRDEEPEN